MRQMADTWLVIPLYNERSVVGDVVAEARAVFPHVLCIDDGSTDDSAQRALNAGAVVIRHPLNLGQGAALQTGFDYLLTRTDARYAVTFDADGQHRVDDALAMCERARTRGLAIVYGSRFLDGAAPIPPLRSFMLRCVAAITSLKTGLRLTDAHNGLRVIRRDALAAVHLQHDRMAHASEIVAQLARTGLPWSEMPVEIRYTPYSRSKGQSILNSVNILVELVMQ